MSARRRNRASEEEQVQSNGGRTGVDLEADPSAAPSGSLQCGPVREMALKGAATAWNCSLQELKRHLLDAYSQCESPIGLEMRSSDLRQRKDQPVRDFASKVDEVGCKADKSESELIGSFILSLASKELHRELCLREQATFTEARQLAERGTAIEEGQRRAVDDSASGNGGLDKTVKALARRMDKLECGSLGHLRGDCPHKRRRTQRQPTGTQSGGPGNRRVLTMARLKAGDTPHINGKLNGTRVCLLLDTWAVVSIF
ncbi:hypothetical protein T06_16919 [Trichinella sp. T6]|nr:hypothetical protein T06_16919 [Trichinella sp. T6]